MLYLIHFIKDCFLFVYIFCIVFLLVDYLLLFLFNCRTAEVFFMFGVRAFVTGAFQAAYVYTPEVRRRFV